MKSKFVTLITLILLVSAAGALVRLDEIRQLVVRIATENRDWGYRRIQGSSRQG